MMLSVEEGLFMVELQRLVAGCAAVRPLYFRGAGYDQLGLTETKVKRLRGQK